MSHKHSQISLKICYVLSLLLLSLLLSSLILFGHSLGKKSEKLIRGKESVGWVVVEIEVVVQCRNCGRTGLKMREWYNVRKTLTSSVQQRTGLTNKESKCHKLDMKCHNHGHNVIQEHFCFYLLDLFFSFDGCLIGMTRDSILILFNKDIRFEIYTWKNLAL